MLLGLRQAEKLGILCTTIESDSMEIFQTIQNPSEHRASVVVITDDCRYYNYCLEKLMGVPMILHGLVLRDRNQGCGMINPLIS